MKLDVTNLGAAARDGGDNTVTPSPTCTKKPTTPATTTTPPAQTTTTQPPTTTKTTKAATTTTPAHRTTTSTTHPQLPITGSNSDFLIGLSAVFLLLGIALVLGARFRRRRREA